MSENEFWVRVKEVRVRVRVRVRVSENEFWVWVKEVRVRVRVRVRAWARQGTLQLQGYETPAPLTPLYTSLP